MNYFDEQIDRLLFIILFLVCVFLFWAFPFRYLDEGFEYTFLQLSISMIPCLFMLKGGKTYAVVFSIDVLVLILLETVTITGYEVSRYDVSPIYILVWQIQIILLVWDLYYGFKIIIKRHINYRNSTNEEKIYQRSLNAVISRTSYFIICGISILLLLIVITKLGLCQNWYS